MSILGMNFGSEDTDSIVQTITVKEVNHVGHDVVDFPLRENVMAEGLYLVHQIKPQERDV
jgi:hypothetical protein